MKNPILQRGRGFTLVELMVGISVGMITLMIAFSVAKTGLTLFARNTSINLAHMSTRNAMDRIAMDIQQSAVQPILTGTLIATGSSSGTFVAVSGSGPCEGIQVKVAVAGPFLLTGNNAASATSLTIVTSASNSIPASISGSGWVVFFPGFPPPLSGTSTFPEPVVSSATVSGTSLTCVLSGSLGQAIDATTATVPVYLGLQVNYYVSGSSLIRRDSRGLSNTLVRNVLTPQPFTQPTTDDLYVGIHLGATNSDYSNRAFISSDMIYNSVWVPFRGGIYNP